MGKKSRLVAVLGLWGIVAAGGFVALNVEASRPGAAAHAPSRFPEDAGLPRPAGRPLLILFAHPRCACTRASLAELDRIVSRMAGKADPIVVLSPSEAAGDSTEMRDIAARIQGVRVIDDAHGAMARHLGVATSGQVLVYDASGELTFAGGITAARGHEGDNDGASAALRAATGGAPGKRWVRAFTDVFGCGLFAAEARR
jgi:hypothetical protein